MFRIAKLAHQYVCGLGRWKVCPQRQKDFYGYASLCVGEVIAVGPTVTPDEHGMPKRHAIITQWPPTKEQRLSVAQQLAAAAEYVPR